MKKVKDFYFKRFVISQDKATHKVGTDGVLLGAWVDVDGTSNALDIGTGSGVIALMLAQRSDALIDAVESERDDAEQAIANVRQSPWRDRVQVIHSTIQHFQTEKKYDLIVSNPPYFVNSWKPPEEKRSKVRHTDALSFQDLLAAAARLLSEQGRFAVVLPFAEGTMFVELAKNFNLHCIRRCEFRSREEKPVERLLMTFSFHEQSLKQESLVLYSNGEEWSDAYKKLMKDFYLKL